MAWIISKQDDFTKLPFPQIKQPIITIKKVLKKEILYKINITLLSLWIRGWLPFYLYRYNTKSCDVKDNSEIKTSDKQSLQISGFMILYVRFVYKIHIRDARMPNQVRSWWALKTIISKIIWHIQLGYLFLG